MDDLRSLFTKYLNNNCSVAEIEALIVYFNDVEKENDLKKAIAKSMLEDEGLPDENDLDDKMVRIYQQLKPALNDNFLTKTAKNSTSSYLKYAIAASIMLIASIVLYFFLIENPDTGKLTAQHQGHEVYPGGNKAILTLADGSKISLTNAGNGALAKQAGIVITKTKDGQLVYEISKNKAVSTVVSYNTITTPAGGQYQVNLPDGSSVWLNAQSSLTYPTTFNGNNRRVILTGEAYFEIVKHPDQPFIVSTNGGGKAQEVTVLGTHFNINSYQNEGVTKTTLLKGSVKVASLYDHINLKPGQQSILGDNIKVMTVDTTQTVDWKNGSFYFNDENIQSIMRKLARWYDIDVVYKADLPNIDFGGEISRTKKLSEVLKVLEITRTIHFAIEGRRVTVMQ